MCLKAVFADYLDLSTPVYRFSVIARYAKPTNMKPEWSDKFFASLPG